jgi:prepilin-type N-terminal cleavage/methylation domain-containing protein
MATMRTRQTRGFTLLETVLAMAVLLIGATGMVGLHMQGLRMEGDARRITRATAIAQDLMDQISTWPWGDPRLGTATGIDTSMLATLGDPGFAYERSTTPTASFSDASGGLTQGGKAWNGIPLSDTQSVGFERYWNVAYVDDSNANGVPDAARIAVIVRYPAGVGYRRVVLLGSKLNPAEAR